MAYDRKANNTTNYAHPNESNLWEVHKAMEYNNQGEPVLRTSISGGITIENVEVTDVEISNDVGNPIPVTGSVLVEQDTSPWVISGEVSLANGSEITINNQPDNPVPVTGEVTLDPNSEIEIKNDANNPIPISRNLSVNADSNPIYVKGTSDTSFFDPMQTDAFGRLRISNPITLFDSFHRFHDNGAIGTYTSGTGSATFNSDAGLIECDIGNSSGDAVYRESSRVFAYQPGKSLLILQTFVMNSPKTNLRQRFGYFDTQNGLFLESSDQVYFVKRSSSSGSIVETRVPQSQWNYDTMDGNGPSGITLDISKAQILFTDIEWLGVGTVRMGFVINGEYHICHKFHHANIINTTYMATACLPVRAEIENTGNTSSPSQLKVICTSVISEGGYELRGRTESAGHEIGQSYDIASSSTVYPIFSMRLKSDHLNGIVLPRNFSVAVTGNTNYRYYILLGGTTSGGVWNDAGADSCIEYKLNATGVSGGKISEVGYIINTNQSSPSPNLEETPFKYQLERNSFTNTAYEFTICLVTTGTNQDAWASVVWDEVT